MKIFEFLYYCLYRVFKLVKRVGVKDEYLAAKFYSILLSTNTIMLFFPLKFVIRKGVFTPFPYNLLIKIMLGSIFFIWYFICKNYFVKEENYIRIISSYENDYKPIVVGILYSIISFLSFITFAMILSRIN